MKAALFLLSVLSYLGNSPSPPASFSRKQSNNLQNNIKGFLNKKKSLIECISHILHLKTKVLIRKLLLHYIITFLFLSHKNECCSCLVVLAVELMLPVYFGY